MNKNCFLYFIQFILMKPASNKDCSYKQGSPVAKTSKANPSSMVYKCVHRNVHMLPLMRATSYAYTRIDMLDHARTVIHRP